jgi:RecB family endonuclease NucS
MEIETGREYKALAWYRHKLRLYEAFSSGAPVSTAEVESEEADEDIGRTFGLERDLQAALRANIQQLEPGLKIVDGGIEKKVEAGLIDILAKDKAGNWVVIELKAEVARPAAATQVLAYMSSIAAENSGEVRGILIASDFDKKVTLAARSIPSLQLKRYRFNFEFE